MDIFHERGHLLTKIILAKTLVEIHDANTSKKNFWACKFSLFLKFACSKKFLDEEWCVVELLFDIYVIKLLTKKDKNLKWLYRDLKIAIPF